MVEKVVKRYAPGHFSEIRENLSFWLSRTPKERVEAVEYLRRQRDGSTARLQRVVRVVQPPCR